MTTNSPATVHVITIYNASSEEPVDLLRFDNFSLPDFIDQFAVDVATDPDMTERYAIGPDDLPLVNKALGYEHPFNFSELAYFVEAALDK